MPGSVIGDDNTVDAAIPVLICGSSLVLKGHRTSWLSCLLRLGTTASAKDWLRYLTPVSPILQELETLHYFKNLPSDVDRIL